MTASASRLGPRFAALQAAPRAALVSFVTAGDPSPEHTVPAMHALVKGGTDILELGIPFSDPEAEGPAIQASSERALAQGMTLKQVLDLVATFRLDDRDTPIVLMGYLNSILAMADFAARAEQAGVDGLIMVNLPPEEGDGLQAELRQHHIDLIFLLAPTTTAARAEKIMQRASGFIYYVSLKGITGADHLQTDVVKARLAELREQTDTPVCVGFGIKDSATAAALAPHADGVVVGSALVNRMAKGGSVTEIAEVLESAAADLRSGL